MAETEVKAKLTVEKGGEQGAFKETADDVRELGTAAATTDAPLDRLEGNLDGVGRSADKAGDEVSDLTGDLQKTKPAADQAAQGVDGVGQSTESLADKMAGGAAKALLYWEVFKQGYAAGTQLKGALNELTDGGFDRVTQGVLQAYGPTKALIDLLDGADAPLVNATAQARLLVANGYDPMKMSAAEVAAAVDEIGKNFAKHKQGQADATEATKAAEKAYQDWLEKLGLAKPKLAEASADLVKFVQTYTAENSKIAALPEPIAKKVAEMLAALKAAGVQAPPELAKIAAQYGIVDAAAAKASVAATKFGADLQASLTGRAELVKGELGKILAGIPEALSKQPPLRFLPPEQLEQAKANLQQLVDATRAAGQQIPAALAEAAGQVGILVGEYETAGQSTTVFAQGTKAASDSMRIVRDEAGRLVAVVSDLGTSSQTSAGQVAGVGTAVDAAAKQLGTAAGEFSAAGEKVGESTTKLEGQGKAAAGAAANLQGATTATTNLAGEQDKAGTSVKSATDRIGELEIKVKELATALEAAAAKPVAAPDFTAWHAAVDSAMAKLNAFIALAQTAANLDLDGGGGAPEGPPEPS